MKKFFLFSLLIVSGILLSQQIHVKYLHVLSPFTTAYEDLYIKNNQVLSIQDSVVIQNKLTGDWTMSVNIDNGRKPIKQYFVSDIDSEKERNIFFTSNVDSKEFFIYDRVPQPEWIIDKNDTKTIAGYKCQKATAIFRGSKVTAYFTKDLPYSTGPFKFYGLPGLILEIRTDNKNHDIWKAEVVNTDEAMAIVYKPKFLNKQKISLREYVAIKEDHMNKIFAKVTENLSNTTSININTSQRFTVEQKYEWENQQ